MTKLTSEPYRIPAAAVGPENPLPNFRGQVPDHKVKTDSNIPTEDGKYLGWETGYRVLPYRMQDGYSRERVVQSLPSLVLENEILRAVVLPGVGGRLVSLYHKPEQREILYRNAIFQPANLSLRNAWFSGGIEWNCPHLGHHCLTCSPVFAAEITGSQQEPALRLYEWDRMKGIPWQVDLHLPPGSPFLFAHIRVVNPQDSTIPMYWWTNIAVPETESSRTLAPAPAALAFPSGTLSLLELPLRDGIDVTYSTRLNFAQEFFFRIPDDQRPWVTALDGDGKGLVHASTVRLRGRKMFCWGTNSGGRRWKAYLGGPGGAYIEIQGGLARTQLESIPMQAHENWSWTEAFGLLHANPEKVHSTDWTEAWQSAGAALERQLSADDLNRWDQALAPSADQPAASILAAGSGWGALERLRLAKDGRPDPIPTALAFDEDTLGAGQHPWIELLAHGAMPEQNADQDPGAWMVQEEWRPRLEESVKTNAGDHWLSWLHLGVMRMEARDEESARDAWLTSISRRANAWAMRNLGFLDARNGEKETACEWLRQAWAIGPRIAPLAVETTRLLVDLERSGELKKFLGDLPEAVREHERMRILCATAALEEGRLDFVEPLFEREFATIKEGERTLTDLWFKFQEQKIAAAEGIPIDDTLRERVRRDFPPPAQIDYRTW